MATANAGYHAYATGDVLTAAQVQYNLQNQTTMYFASASARTTALTGVLVEGMVSYIPANGIEYYNGSAWVSISQAVTALTTKGDLLTYSTQDTRLPVGSDGQTLVANSAATTGLQWASTPSASNPILNSAMQVWQRGTSIAVTTSAYTADRWQAYRFVAGATVSRQVTNDTTNLPNIQYCARVQRDSGNTATDQIWFSQSFETVNTIPFVGKTITLSYYARKGANYSSTSDSMSVLLFTGTGTDQNITGYTGSASTLNAASTLTSTWQRFSQSVAIPTTTTEMGVQFRHTTPTGTAGTNDYFEITGVQIDIGSVALPFRTYAATIQGELAACQRYYVRVGDSSGASNQRLARGVANATTTIQFTATLPVQLRTGNSTTIDFSSLQAYDGSSVFAVSAVSSSSISTLNPAITATVSGATLKQFYELLTTSTSGYIAFSAEL